MREYKPSVFTARIERLRKDRGVRSERAFCASAGVAMDAVRQVRSGRSRSLTGESLFKIAGTFRVSVDWLLGLSDVVPGRSANEPDPAREIETLGAYLKATDTSPTAFARNLDCAHTTVLRYLDGSRIPRPDMMRRILAATGGRVTAHSFYPIEIPAPKRKRA